MSKQILVFGDSIAYGAWDEAGGWVERLKIFTNNKSIESNLEFYCAVYNLAIDGDTTEDLLNRADFEIRQRAHGEETIIVFAIGSSDSEVIGPNNTPKVSPEKFSQNIKELISVSQRYSAKIIFTGLLPVDQSKVDPIPWAPDRSYKNDSIKEYSDIIRSLCLENKIDFVGLFELFEKIDYKSFLEDGVHPNSKGHNMIFGIIYDHLMRKKIIY